MPLSWQNGRGLTGTLQQQQCRNRDLAQDRSSQLTGSAVRRNSTCAQCVSAYRSSVSRLLGGETRGDDVTCQAREWPVRSVCHRLRDRWVPNEAGNEGHWRVIDDASRPGSTAR